MNTITMEDIENRKEKDVKQNVSKNTKLQSIHDGSSGSSGVIDIESAKADPVGMKLWLEQNTSVSVGVDGLETKVPETGILVDPRNGQMKFGWFFQKVHIQ